MDATLDETAKARLDPLKGAFVLWVKDQRPDLTNRQLALLLIVCIEPGQHYLRHLAVRLGVAKPIVCRILDRLSDLGLIRRQQETQDRRNIFVVPTVEAIDFLMAFEHFFQNSSHEGSVAG